MGRRARRVLLAGLVALWVGAVAQAQEPPAAGVIRKGEPQREIKAWTPEGPTLDPDSVIIGPDDEVVEVPGREWRKVESLTLEEIEEESTRLKEERSVRVRSIGAIEAEVTGLAERLTRTKVTDKERDKFAYQRALRVYRLATEQSEVRHINARLAVLSTERARRREGAETPTDPEAVAASNVREVRRAMAVLAEYDRAIGNVLRREPFTEADVIYALGLLEEKTPITEVVTEYLRVLEEQTTEGAPASSTEERAQP